MITKIENVLFTGKTHTTPSRREGARRGEDVDIRLSTPGTAGNEMEYTAIANHPLAEQLFAGAWSACYTGALHHAAQMKKVTLPPDMSVDIQVELGTNRGAYFLQARIDVSMPGLAPEVVDAIAQAAHGVCPYSKAVHGNIEVTTNVVSAAALAAA